MKKNNSALRWIYARTKRFIPALILTTLLNIIVSVAMVYMASLSGDVIDAAIGASDAKLSSVIITLFAVLAIQLILPEVFSAINVRLMGKLTIHMRNSMFSSIVRKKYPQVFDHHSGDLLNRFTSDIDQIVTSFSNIIPGVASMVTKIVAGLASLIMQNYFLALIILGIGIVFPAVGRLLKSKHQHYYKDAQRTEGLSRSFLQEGFQNIVVIKTFSSEKPILNKLNEYMDENFRIKIKRNFVTIVTHFFMHAFFMLGYYLLLVWGATQVGAGLFTYGTLTKYLRIVSIIQSPLQSISGVVPQYYAATASAERLMELENIESEPEPVTDASLDRLKKDFETINLNNVAFAYDNELILKNCSFEIKKGGITAITGGSGSGKSTVFKLLLGLYEPAGGTITFNGDIPINASTRGMFSYVPQGNMILSGTIKENITLCNSNVSDEEIEKAAKAAAIYDFIKELPNGFETKLSERGAGLSEGQVQRLSIARALLFDAPILLLDESTSALDEQTETELLSNIKSMTDKTVLFITHRNTSISVCDHIVHVEDKKFENIK